MAVLPAPMKRTGTWNSFCRLIYCLKKYLATRMNRKEKHPVIPTNRRDTTSPTLPKYMSMVMVRIL